MRVTPEGEDWEQRLEKRIKGGGPGPPKWVRPFFKNVWDTKCAPLEIVRFLGPKNGQGILDKYVCRRSNEEINDSENEAISQVLYQIIMRPATTEAAISILFSPSLQSKIPLGAKDKLASP